MTSKIDRIKQYWEMQSRKDFMSFRQYIHFPRFKSGWFMNDLASTLQSFYEDLTSNKAPILLIQAPPQHGKSDAVVDFIAWVLGKSVNLPIIYASFSNTLGIRANRNLQRIIDSEKYQAIFPAATLPVSNAVSVSSKPLRNKTAFELPAVQNTFRNTTVNGAITGESLAFGVIDDPVKGRKEANSKTVRNAVWEWFTDDFFTRFTETAGLLCIMTRWHTDDLFGRMQKYNPNIKVVSFKAIAEKDERHRKEGEALFPELKSLDFLHTRKELLSKTASNAWEALYQQNPIPKTGNMFDIEDWRYWETLPPLKYKYITADTAQKTKTWNDYTVFQCWGYGIDKNIYLLDMVRKKVKAPELRKLAISFYNKHNQPKKRVSDPLLRAMYIEDKSSGTGLIQELKKKQVRVHAVPRTIDKVTRAEDASIFVASGRVFLSHNIKGSEIIVEEGKLMPEGTFDDAIDCTMTAIEKAFMTQGSAGLMEAMQDEKAA